MPMRALSRQERMAVAAKVMVQPTSVSAPVKGWNTRDALDAMDPLDAVTLDNWYPDQGSVNVRNGFTQYGQLGNAPAFSSGFSSGFATFGTLQTQPVQTLAEFHVGTTWKLIAAAGNGFYDASSNGYCPLIQNGFTSSQWQWEPFLQNLFFCNGLDPVQIYNGSTFANASFTGVTTSTLIGVRQYQQRLFFWQNNSTGFWFAPLNSLSGTLSFYDLSAFSPHGGNIVTAITFSHDGGNGVQDFIAFVMSSGDTLVFFGNDPSNANAWALVGLYRLSPPVHIRAVCQYGAEAFLTTFDDHVPLQQQLVALKLGQLPPRSKVSGAVQAAVNANAGAFGWQALYYPAGRRLIFNVPNTNGTFDQHVCNTGIQDQPWCRFTGMNAFCWGLFKNGLFFGAAGGIIFQADTGSLDNTSPVNANAQQAWNDLGSPLRKHVTALRPVLQSLGQAGINFAIGFDFGAVNIGTTIAIPVVGSPWDISPWDTSPWSAEQIVSAQWSASGGTGVSVGMGISVAAVQSVKWLRTDFRGALGNAL